MSDASSNDIEYNALYKMPIEQLGLSAETNKLLGESGMTSVGDCIAFYHYFQFATVSASLELRNAMSNEVKKKLQEHGYWRFTQA